MGPIGDPLVEITDALDRAGDLVTALLDLRDGRLGGAGQVGRSWSGRRLGHLSARWRVGEGGVAAGWASVHGPEQLRKATIEAERIPAALAALERNPGEVDLAARLRATGVVEVADRLCGLDSSKELRGVAAVLDRAAAVLAEGRTRRFLAERRTDLP